MPSLIVYFVLQLRQALYLSIYLIRRTGTQITFETAPRTQITNLERQSFHGRHTTQVRYAALLRQHFQTTHLYITSWDILNKLLLTI